MGNLINGSSGPPAEGQKANVFDPSAIKAVLDLATVQAMRKEKYEEDHTHSNLKLFLGFLACLVGVSAYIYPVPFPENRQFLKWCVILYFAFSSLIQAITFVFYRDVVFVSTPKKLRKTDNLYLRIISKLPRYHTKYKLTIKAILNDQVAVLEKEFDIQDYFDAEGNFFDSKYWGKIAAFIKEAVEASKKKSN